MPSPMRGGINPNIQQGIGDLMTMLMQRRMQQGAPQIPPTGPVAPMRPMPTQEDGRMPLPAMMVNPFEGMKRGM